MIKKSISLLLLLAAVVIVVIVAFNRSTTHTLLPIPSKQVEKCVKTEPDPINVESDSVENYTAENPLE